MRVSQFEFLLCRPGSSERLAADEAIDYAAGLPVTTSCRSARPQPGARSRQRLSLPSRVAGRVRACGEPMLTSSMWPRVPSLRGLLGVRSRAVAVLSSFDGAQGRLVLGRPFGWARPQAYEDSCAPGCAPSSARRPHQRARCAGARSSRAHIADAPVLAIGRLELLHYVREQSISVDYHRYGQIPRQRARRGSALEVGLVPAA